MLESVGETSLANRPWASRLPITIKLKKSVFRQRLGILYFAVSQRTSIVHDLTPRTNTKECQLIIRYNTADTAVRKKYQSVRWDVDEPSRKRYRANQVEKICSYVAL